jgi:hypothetical protein
MSVGKLMVARVVREGGWDRLGSLSSRMARRSKINFTTLHHNGEERFEEFYSIASPSSIAAPTRYEVIQNSLPSEAESAIVARLGCELFDAVAQDFPSWLLRSTCPPSSGTTSSPAHSVMHRGHFRFPPIPRKFRRRTQIAFSYQRGTQRRANRCSPPCHGSEIQGRRPAVLR